MGSRRNNWHSTGSRNKKLFLNATLQDINCSLIGVVQSAIGLTDDELIWVTLLPLAPAIVGSRIDDVPCCQAVPELCITLNRHQSTEIRRGPDLTPRCG